MKENRALEIADALRDLLAACLAGDEKAKMMLKTFLPYAALAVRRRSKVDQVLEADCVH